MRSWNPRILHTLNNIGRITNKSNYEKLIYVILDNALPIKFIFGYSKTYYSIVISFENKIIQRLIKMYKQETEKYVLNANLNILTCY